MIILRHVIRPIVLTIFLLFTSAGSLVFSQGYSHEAGYVNHFSSANGDTVRFYISTSKNPFTLSIYKIEDEDRYLTKFDGVQGGIQPLQDSSYYYGCNWKYRLSIVIPDSWKPGAYRAVFPTSDSSAGIIFFVTERQPGSYSKILFVSSTNTWNAYNFYGGKSLYGFNSSDSEASLKVSYLRPNWYPYGGLDFFNYERETIRWLARNKIYPEFITDTELHLRQDVLQHYDVVFIVGHSEYWTSQHRWQFQNYLNNGGRIIILAGATCWSQVRFDGDKMVCYRNVTTDPLYGVVDSLITSIFNKPPVNWPENPLIGVSGQFGGYVNHNGVYDDSQGFGDYAAYNTYNWVFKNTFLREGEEYGFQEHIVGDEDDGAGYQWRNGVPTVTGVNGTPLNFKILSLSPAQHYQPELGIQGWAVMGLFIHPNGGAVFNASSIRWAWGLKSNRYVQQITKNVLDKFINKNCPPDLTSWSPSIVDSQIINTKMHYLNKRDFFLTGSSLNQTFSVAADDPLGESVNCVWAENGVITGTGTSLTVNKNNIFQNSKKYTIKAFVYNSKDTSTITWNYFNTQLVFSSEPVTQILPNSEYVFRLDAFNNYHDVLTYEILEKPSWLTVDKNNTLTGIAPAGLTTYKITARVTNKHNQADTLTYNLEVTNVIINVSETPSPNEFSLYQNYPNPFNPLTRIRYAIGSLTNGQTGTQRTILKVYDLLGKEMSTLVNEEKPAGVYEVEFDARNLSSGIYFYTLKSGKFLQTKKMIILK